MHHAAHARRFTRGCRKDPSSASPGPTCDLQLSHGTPHIDVTRRARAKYFFHENPSVAVDAELDAQFERRLDLGDLYLTLPLLSTPLRRSSQSNYFQCLSPHPTPAPIGDPKPSCSTFSQDFLTHGLSGMRQRLRAPHPKGGPGDIVTLNSPSAYQAGHTRRTRIASDKLHAM